MHQVLSRVIVQIKTLVRVTRYAVGYIYGCYLTLRFVDEYQRFPAIIFDDRLIALRIIKGQRAKLCIRGRIVVSPWLARTPSSIRINEDATCVFEADFSIGDDVHIKIVNGAKLRIGGRDIETMSGITARSVVMVRNSVVIGKDVLIAWDTLITDSDWHTIGGSPLSEDVNIGDHVWIGNGSKILKGTHVGTNSIVAAGAVVARGCYPERCLLAGVPAKVVRTSIPDWHR